METIAHRGASFDAPENTLASFQLAFEQGANACELDAQFSQDSQIVVIHDFTTWRTGGVDRTVREQTIEELKQLDAGGWKDKRFAGQRIPLLSEVLSALPEQKRLFVEIKIGPEILPELDRVFQAAPAAANRVSLIGFNHDTMRKVRAWFPEMEIYWLRSFTPEQNGRDPRALADPLIETAVAAGFDGLDLLHTGPIDAEFVARAHLARKKVFVWTIDDALSARRMADFGVDGIVTNRPEWLRKQLPIEAFEAHAAKNH